MSHCFSTVVFQQWFLTRFLRVKTMGNYETLYFGMTFFFPQMELCTHVLYMGNFATFYGLFFARRICGN